MARSGHVVSGASTLTMQAAACWSGGRAARRQSCVEVGKALELERAVRKDDVLGLYLTLAPFGGNLEGVRAASLAYFGKEPARLSPAEAALLVALPRAPERLRPDRHPEAARAARDRYWRGLRERGIISRASAGRGARRAGAAGAGRPCRSMRRIWRGLCATRAGAVGAAHDDRPRCCSARLEALAAARGRGARPAGDARRARRRQPRPRRSSPMSATPISPPSRGHGTIDMARARALAGLGAEAASSMPWRSTGCIIHPQTMLDDRPRAFRRLLPPRISTGDFHGEVSAARGAAIFAERAGRGGARPARPAAVSSPRSPPPASRLRLPQRPSGARACAMALGGAGIRLVDLAMLYVALSHDGGERAAAIPRPTSRAAPAIDDLRAARRLVCRRHPARCAAAARPAAG